MLFAVLFVIFVVAFYVADLKEDAYIPMAEHEVTDKLNKIVEQLESEIRINNFAFGGYAPDYKHIVDEYHKYEETCNFIRRRDLKFYGLAVAINNIAAAVRTYKIEVLKLDADRQFYVELNNIQKELQMLSKQARIVRF